MGNGYVGTTVGGTDTYLAGVFNGVGNKTPSHRARLQSNLAVTITNAQVTACALDIERATYYRQSTVGTATIEQRWYAHRARRSLMVMELQVWVGANAETLTLTTNPGGPSTDITFTTVRPGTPTYMPVHCTARDLTLLCVSRNGCGR